MNFWMLAANQPAAQAQAQGGGYSFLISMALVFAVFWFLMIMPQRKQQKQRNTMLGNLKEGDKVVTIGGIHGEIIELKDEDVKLRVADKVDIKFAKSAISRVKG